MKNLLKPEILNQRIRIENLYLLPPEEVLLIKALLQRGSDVSKHDIEDIHHFKSIYRLNQDYIHQRISDLDAIERVGAILD